MAITVKTKIDKGAIDKTLARVDRIKNAVTSQDAAAMGKAVIEEMKSMISKGISPVAGFDRFPAYKAAATRKVTKPGSKKVAKTTQRGYPFSVQDKYPGKKPRPVNLYLSGEFLNDLKFQPYKAGFGYGVTVGYSGKSALKERGHREGANGQPVRPTIPTAQEGFAQRIQRLIRDHVKKAIGRANRGR